MSESLPVRVNELSKVLLGLISCPSSQLEKNVLDFKESLGSLSSSDVGVDTELVFRNTLDCLLISDDGSNNPCSFETSSNKGRIVGLLNFAIELGKLCEQLSFNIPKIPFIIIEDLLQSQTLSNALLIWEIVESKVNMLTLPVLFNRGKFIVLRTCNALLKRLSRSCHTEFCGRVLMFLATVYPLSEKSAVNLTGKVNVGNVTQFEDEENFSLTNGKENSNEKVDDKQDPNIMEVDSTVPASGGSGGESHVDYQLYKSFWEIQSYFSSDPKSLENKNKWPALIKSANMLLETFEADSGNSSDMKQARRRRQKEKEDAIRASEQGDLGNSLVNSKGPRSEYMGCKYLTSSQLFLLEMQDPFIRQQFAIQLLITIHHRLRNMPPITKPTSSKVKPDFVSEEDLKKLESRVYKLLQNTPSPCGDDLMMTLRSIFSSSASADVLSREDGWLKWKQDHCPSFQREASKHSEIMASGERKRKRIASQALSGATDKKESFYFEHEWEEMQEAAKALTQRVPSLEKHIEDFIDAEDPDAGIEDEYHPKHDTVYCWRARRLMARTKLSAFEDMAEGNVAKGLKLLGMIPQQDESTRLEKKEANHQTEPMEDD